MIGNAEPQPKRPEGRPLGNRAETCRRRRLLDPVVDDANARDGQIPALDGLRGIAVLFVLLSHLSNANLDLLPFLSFSGIGKVGVWLFFVLSAFLLTSQFLARDNQGLLQPTLWSRYFLRRFFRIYPLFIVVMVVSFLLRDASIFPPLAAPESLQDLRDRLLLLDAKGVEWSVLVEFRFYFLLPVIIVLLAWLRRWPPVASYLLFITAILAANWLAPAPSFTAMSPYLVVFLFGILAAYIHHQYGPRARCWSGGAKRLAEIVSLLAFLVIVLLTPSLYSLLIGRTVPLNHFHESLALFGFLWSLFLISLLFGSGQLAWLLSRRALRFIGIISFGLYLWHPPVIKVIADHSDLPTPFGGSLVLVVTIALATLTYITVERPFLRIRLKRVPVGAGRAEPAA